MHLILKTAAAAAIGVVAWRAWQRHRAHVPDTGSRDDADSTPPRGDPRVPAVEPGPETAPRAAAQFSRGFGEEV